MAKIFCVSNQKGGSGKTTGTMNLAAVLAIEHGKKVLMVDIDGQANLTTAFGFNPDDIQEKRMSTYDLLISKKPETEKYILKTEFKNLDLIPSSQDTFMLDQDLLNMTRREYRLDKAIKQIDDKYDFVFIDTAPNLGFATFNAFVASNYVIITYSAASFSLDGISQLVKTVYSIQDDEDLNINDTKIIGSVWNTYDKRTSKINNKAEKALNGVKAIGERFARITRATAIEQSQEDHKPMIVFNKNHEVSEQYRKLAKEVLTCVK